MHELAVWIPWIPAVAVILCGLCCTRRDWQPLAPVIAIAGIGIAFIMSLVVAGAVGTDKSFSGTELVAFEWIRVGGLEADFRYFLDPLTVIMLLVVTGIGLLVAIYAAGYMHGDRGLARFFAHVSLFIFAMLTLVLADNLVLLYLGWEGVGLCSYLLIGHYYERPSAAAAAKKAFIVNRIGDLGFALGIFLTYVTFDTVSLHGAVEQARAMSPEEASTAQQAIPFLLMLGAFGKSAQLPLHVWLPDAMEGPTPVSALIHAATMVTAGVYMIARLLPVYELSPWALPVVAIVGAATALFAATIALCQYDLKRIYAYSTISQLGYMFLGVGAASAVGGVFHLFTHAFFKALLFLTAGSVMHALAGQLDLRKISGLRTKMPWTCWLMFVGCLALAGFPLTAGFVSKDLILANAMAKGGPLFVTLTLVGLAAAFLTAFYTFRLWFSVFLGPTAYEMGDQHHGEADETEHHGHADAHEVGWLMNGPLVVLAAGSLLAGLLFHGWVEDLVTHSTAASSEAAHGGGHGAQGGHGDGGHGATLMGVSLHLAMQLLSGLLAIAGIALAGYFHWLNRPAAEAVANRFGALVRVLNRKYYVDELYHYAVVVPLRTIGWVCYTFDRLVIDGLVSAVGGLPGRIGALARTTQSGVLQGYGLAMIAGMGLIALLTLMLV